MVANLPFDDTALPLALFRFDAIKKMQDLSISQIPVFDGNEVVGLITEDGIVKHLLDSDESQR